MFVLVLAICFAATPALAGKYDEDVARPYLTLSGGVSKVYGVDFDNVSTVNSYRLTTDYGYNGMVAAGLAYRVGRIELSGGYRYLKNDEIKINGAPAIPASGNVDAYDLLLSVFYDFNSDGTLSPYFGGGVGAARVNLNDGTINKKDIGFAYQLGAGINLNMSKSFAIDLGYRLLGVTNLDYGAVKMDGILFHNANMGLRFLF
jgi:opacity protein-like surface antigen